MQNQSQLEGKKSQKKQRKLYQFSNSNRPQIALTMRKRPSKIMRRGIISTYRIRFKHSAYDQSGEDLGRQTRDFSEGEKGDLKHQECNREQQTVITFLSSVLSASQINFIPPTSMKIMVLGRAGCFDASTCTCANVCCFCVCVCFVLFCVLKMSVVVYSCNCDVPHL